MTRRRDGETASRLDGREKTASSGEVGVARVLGTVRRAAVPDGIDPNLVEIRPEPSSAERAAILIALEQMLEAKRKDAPRATPWAVAGRHESRLARTGGVRAGWGRGADRLAGW